MERKTALELLEPNKYDDLPVLSRYWGVLSATALGLAACAIANLAARRPLVSGMQFSHK
jgi:hypothetical protein